MVLWSQWSYFAVILLSGGNAPFACNFVQPLKQLYTPNAGCAEFQLGLHL
jgi:hypothetical protein